MDRRSLYDEDIYAWAQQQAATLRRLADTRRDLPNELDLENVAEEIGDVGRSELSKVESFIRLILTHVLKAASAPQARSNRKWRKETLLYQAELERNLTGSMQARIDMDDLWRLALLQADADLGEHDDALLPDLPSATPFRLLELLGDRFDFDASVERVRSAGAQKSQQIT